MLVRLSHDDMLRDDHPSACWRRDLLMGSRESLESGGPVSSSTGSPVPGQFLGPDDKARVQGYPFRALCVPAHFT